MVEVNHCAGSCQGYVACVATETKPLIITVQKFDFFLDPYKPTCGSTELQEDVSCQCKCLVNKDDCHKNQVFNSYACKCICPNAEEERQCIKEGNKWNSEQCTCLNHQ
ncbi:hypothetical protein J437_LFUL006737 [Ladona fulva]|uniref:Uncharacterized protein n=1 Tax=Ladona fulva TaxID=123851 RepID=A0A8K0K506_LADFU|nr:hypothetical protein J437_LFUL006737 [Ladona fulva]